LLYTTKICALEKFELFSKSNKIAQFSVKSLVKKLDGMNSLRNRRRLYMKHLYAKVVIVFLVVVLSVSSFCGIFDDADLLPGTHSIFFNYSGHQRHFYIHIPEKKRYEKYPVVIMLHGGVSNSKFSMKRFGWMELSDKEGFIAIFPDALPPIGGSSPDNTIFRPQSWWEGLNIDPRKLVFNDSVDDVGFIATIIQELKSEDLIDEKRVFLTGYSNGATMAMFLGLKLSNVIAAVAPVCGLYVPKDQQKISSPISVMVIIGMDDPFNPYYGGLILPPWSIKIVKKPPVETTIMKWVNLLGLPEQPVEQYENEDEKFVLYSNGETDFYFHVFKKLGHFWPQADLDYPLWYFGGRYDEINATEMIWEFFKKHPKR